MSSRVADAGALVAGNDEIDIGGIGRAVSRRIGFIILVACGPFLKLEEIWVMSDIVNGLMALPNLIALVALSGVVVAETKAYQQHLKEESELVPAKLAEETNH